MVQPYVCSRLRVDSAVRSPIAASSFWSARDGRVLPAGGVQFRSTSGSKPIYPRCDRLSAAVRRIPSRFRAAAQGVPPRSRSDGRLQACGGRLRKTQRNQLGSVAEAHRLTSRGSGTRTGDLNGDSGL